MMTLYRTWSRDLTVRRPLTFLELTAIRTAIDDDAADPCDMVDRAAAAVFTALLGADAVDGELDCRADRARHAIPLTQWTAIAGAVTDRAAAWGAGVEAGMLVAGLLPSFYDDPDTPVLRLDPADGRSRLGHLDLAREAADTITACGNHVAELGAAYGTGSSRYQEAADSWREALEAILGAPSRGRCLVQPDGPLSLVVSTDGGPGFAITFCGEPHRCALDGCHAVRDARAGAEPVWRPRMSGAAVHDHDHVPHYPFDGPQPGVWVKHP
ncbi:hypothetical protein DMB66_47450 [Actinoplanes sp. ATCC 53533]|uniref:hypothetical protein n=1 Tax=Actinoplanes sp. ATCC 53533 TaxID=1288362 RepID=UPI000F7AE082|nr:hypothetical protein [Actinoplanes sp. ATCC 53533]RSM47775.1 hypothetical protein DMB66_47450 [Actinoplanes sp. ATCC 53533]